MRKFCVAVCVILLLVWGHAITPRDVTTTSTAPGMSQERIAAGMLIIRVHGYQCNVVTYALARVSLLARQEYWQIECDNRYNYELRDVGGHIIVTPDD